VMSRPLRLVGLTVLLLTGCMVGPDYVRPSAPMTVAYKEAPPPGEGWMLAQPSDEMARGQWWEIFGDPQLNALEEQVTPANQDLKVAEAHFRQARAIVRFDRASLFPTISAGVGVSSVRESANRPFGTRSFPSTGDFLLSFDLSYELDLWGRIRRTVAAAREEAQATAADLETVRVPTVGGSTAKCCVPMGALPDAFQFTTKPYRWENRQAEMLISPHRKFETLADDRLPNKP
jgi:outer membrane protein TolC